MCSRFVDYVYDSLAFFIGVTVAEWVAVDASVWSSEICW